jgi:hypothetical protein
MVHEAGRSLTMGDPFRFADQPARRGALADAADRLDRIVNIVKDQQLSHTQSGPRRPESEAYVASPEEAWSKKYMIQCVGPVCTIRPTAEGALLLPRFMPAPPVREAAQTREVAPMPPRPRPGSKAGRKGEQEPIGLLIGKNVRRRGLLGRLFGR